MNQTLFFADASAAVPVTDRDQARDRHRHCMRLERRPGLPADDHAVAAALHSRRSHSARNRRHLVQGACTMRLDSVVRADTCDK